MNRFKIDIKIENFSKSHVSSESITDPFEPTWIDRGQAAHFALSKGVHYLI